MQTKYKKKETASSQTLKALMGIRDLIASEEVLGGERLSELALVERLGLSRTPIRAALARLELEGLIQTIPSGGYSVRSFSEADIIDSIEMRGLLEGMAARLAAERSVTSAQIAQAKNILVDLDNAIGASADNLDFEAYVELNEQFHELLATMSSSEILQRELKRVVALPFASPSAFVAVRAEQPEFQASLVTAQFQHRSIIEAIELREGTRAEALAREHARLARFNLDKVLEFSKSTQNKVVGLALISSVKKET